MPLVVGTKFPNELIFSALLWQPKKARKLFVDHVATQAIHVNGLKIWNTEVRNRAMPGFWTNLFTVVVAWFDLGRPLLSKVGYYAKSVKWIVTNVVTNSHQMFCQPFLSPLKILSFCHMIFFKVCGRNNFCWWHTFVKILFANLNDLSMSLFYSLHVTIEVGCCARFAFQLVCKFLFRAQSSGRAFFYGRQSCTKFRVFVTEV